LSYRTDRAALQRLERQILGKRILFTDNHDWSTAEIILAYRSQFHVEAAFRDMKALEGVRWEPMHHWTDQKIRVHAFYCVLALLLSTLLHRRAVQAGLALSWGRLREELAAIQEVITLHPGPSGGRPRARTTYTQPGAEATRLVQLFDLERLQVR